MGNIVRISFKRDVSDDEFEKELSSVIDELFDDRVYAKKHGDWSEWQVFVQEDLVEDTPISNACFIVRRYGPRTFGGKRGRNIGEWIRVLVLETTACRFGHATVSDEGGDITWSPKSLEWLTYESYLRNVRHNFSRLTTDKMSEIKEELVREEMKFVPEELLKSNAAEES